MDRIGFDLHKRESQPCTITDDGELLEQRIATSREQLTAVLGAHPPARILLEASTENEWVARHLAQLVGRDAVVRTRTSYVAADRSGINAQVSTTRSARCRPNRPS
jgi:hypothetical protein